MQVVALAYNIAQNIYPIFWLTEILPQLTIYALNSDGCNLSISKSFKYNEHLQIACGSVISLIF